MENHVKRTPGGECLNRVRVPGGRVWCFACYTNIRGRTSIKGHAGYRSPPTLTVPFERYVIMQKPPAKSEQPLGSLPAVDDQWVKKYPTILAYLVDEKWDDGTPREPSALSITVKDGDFQLALNDKDLKQSVYTQAHTLQDGLRLLEGALKDGKCTWRPWKAGKRR